MWARHKTTSSFLHRLHRVDRINFVRNRTIPTILPSGKHILVDTMFKISICYMHEATVVQTWPQSLPVSSPLIPVWLDTQQKRITIPINVSSSFIHCKACRHECESVKTMYLDAAEFLICTRALMIAQISAVKQEYNHGTFLIFP